MKHAFKLATASMAAVFAVSASATTTVTTFDIDFEDGTVGNAPTAAASVGTWTLGSGESAIAIADGNKYLELDTPTNSAVQFEPAKVGTSKIEMDVQFVGTSEEPLASRTGTQAALYLKRDNESHTTNLWLSVNAGSFANTGIPVVEGTWYKVQLVFDYTSSQKSVALSVFTTGGSQVGSTYSANSGTTATGIVGVDFYGSGKVDNFVGQYAEYSTPIPTSQSTSSGDGSGTNTVATINDGVLSPNFAASYNGNAIKFIKVEGTIGGVTGQTRTLRVVNNNQDIAVQAAGFTAISKIVAYYGDDVTATTGATPEITDATVNNGEVSGSVASAKSGLYYATVENVSGVVTTNAILNRAILPQEHGTNLTFTVTPATGPYSVKKFKVIAADSL